MNDQNASINTSNNKANTSNTEAINNSNTAASSGPCRHRREIAVIHDSNHISL